jgi:hypothetical protein
MFLFAFIFFGTVTSSFAAEYGIFSLSEEPKIDTTVSDTIEITIDFTEEAKQRLRGSGSIPVSVDVEDYIKATPKQLDIEYTGSNTVPTTLKISLDEQEIIDVGVQNEKYISTEFSLDTKRGELHDYQDIALLIHGEEYNTVRDYVAKKGFDMKNGRTTLVDYNIPEQFFMNFYERTYTTGSNTSFAYQFDLGTDYREKLGYCPVSSGSCPTFLRAYKMNSYGFESYEEYQALKEEYKQSNIDNFTFSLGSQVPIEFFQKHVPKFEGEDSGTQDYSISHLYNKRQGKKLIEKEGFDKKSTIKKLKREYGVEDFSSILPSVLLNITQTISDPQSANNRPLAIYVRTSELSEGTFSDKHLLASLSKYHNIILAQVGNNEELDEVLMNIKEKFPQADLLVLSSHGNSWGMEFIGVKDIPSFDLISGVLKPEATIFLSSCSTAKRIRQLPEGPFAYILSKYVPGRTIIAAKDLTNSQFLRHNPYAQDASRKYTAFMQGTPIAVIKNGIEQNFIK